MTEKLETLREKTQFHNTDVFRQGNVLIKETGAWASSVHSLLRHLENEGFSAAPRVVNSGFDSEGRETLTFIEGDFIDPGPWTMEATHEIGRLLRELHTATSSYQAPPNAIWRQWFGREIGEPSVIGHCDAASWNIVARGGMPHALIDWEYAGPVDPLVELAQVCWLNAKLHDDIVAEIEGLPAVTERAHQLRAIVDGYGLPSTARKGFIDRIIEFVVMATANEADQANLRLDTPLGSLDQQVPWALAWRSRSAAWIMNHRQYLQNALT